MNADRKDGFDGPIEVAISGTPAGYQLSNSLTIEAGHSTAQGTVQALADATPRDDAEWKKVKITATAKIGGKVLGFDDAVKSAVSGGKT